FRSHVAAPSTPTLHPNGHSWARPECALRELLRSQNMTLAGFSDLKFLLKRGPNGGTQIRDTRRRTTLRNCVRIRAIIAGALLAAGATVAAAQTPAEFY